MNAAEAKIIFTSDGPIKLYQPRFETVRVWIKKDEHLRVYISQTLRNYMHFELDENGHLICVSRDKANFRLNNGRLEVMT